MTNAGPRVIRSSISGSFAVTPSKVIARAHAKPGMTADKKNPSPSIVNRQPSRPSSVKLPRRLCQLLVKVPGYERQELFGDGRWLTVRCDLEAVVIMRGAKR